MKKIILFVMAVVMAVLFAGCNAAAPRYTTREDLVPYTYGGGGYHAGADGRVSGGRAYTGGTYNGGTYNGGTYNGGTYSGGMPGGGYTGGMNGGYGTAPRARAYGPRAANPSDSALYQSKAPRAS